MSEIEKLYINADVKKEWKPLPYGDIEEYYPEFTAEKQLNLLCFLINFGVEITMQKCGIPIKTENIANNLAGITNEVWQDLTDTEKAEIKRILE